MHYETALFLVYISQAVYSHCSSQIIHDSKLFMMVMVLVLIDVIVILVWQIVDPFTAQQRNITTSVNIKSIFNQTFYITRYYLLLSHSHRLICIEHSARCVFFCHGTMGELYQIHVYRKTKYTSMSKRCRT